MILPGQLMRTGGTQVGWSARRVGQSAGSGLPDTLAFEHADRAYLMYIGTSTGSQGVTVRSEARKAEASAGLKCIWLMYSTA